MELKELLQQGDQNKFLEELRANPRQALEDIIQDPTEEEYREYDIHSFGELQEKMHRDPRVIDLLKHDPVGFLQKIAKDPPQPEFKIYRLLVGSLCAIVMVIIIGMILAWFMKNSRDAPTSITAIGCFALGLLAGTFISVPGRNMRNNEHTKPSANHHQH